MSPAPDQDVPAESGVALEDTAPPADRRLLAIAGVLLAIPIIALMWVSTYNKAEPRLWGFPFFFWYQFLWVFLCAGLTSAAYLLVLKARPHRPLPGHSRGASSDTEGRQ